MEIKITDKSTGKVYTTFGELVTLFEKIDAESEVSPADIKSVIENPLTGENTIEDYCGEKITLPSNYHIDLLPS